MAKIIMHHAATRPSHHIGDVICVLDDDQKPNDAWENVINMPGVPASEVREELAKLVPETKPYGAEEEGKQAWYDPVAKKWKDLAERPKYAVNLGDATALDKTYLETADKLDAFVRLTDKAKDMVTEDAKNHVEVAELNIGVL